MRFYIVNETSISKEIGPDFPQIQEVRGMNSEIVIDLATKFGQPFDQNLDIGTPVLRNRAKHTDFISASIIMNTGFIVKNEFIKSLQLFSNNSMEIFDLTIAQKENFFSNYKYCHFSKVYNECINFESSAFKCFGSNTLQTFDNLEKLNTFITNDPTFTSFYPEHVTLKYLPGLELFKIHNNLKFTYCTQVFFDWYLTHNGSGLEFKSI